MVRLADIRKNWRVLDERPLGIVQSRLISHEKFTTSDVANVEHVQPPKAPRLPGARPSVWWPLYAWRLLTKADRETVVIVNGGTPIWIWVGLANRFLFRNRRTILCWDVFVESRNPWKQAIFRAATLGIDLSVVWSGKQVASHARFLHVDVSRFIFLPFKSNHSKRGTYDLPIRNYVFSGGNGKRDFRCLVDAVRDTGVPILISSTSKEVRSAIENLPNVVALAATEPDFGKLQAGARLVVIPMTSTGLKGGGEANFCNGMWHGKPVIAADDISAHEYIVDGQTGFVVPSGDRDLLRERILTLWNDEKLAAAMGRKGRERVEANFTHQQFVDRLLRLAITLGNSRRENEGSHSHA